MIINNIIKNIIRNIIFRLINKITLGIQGPDKLPEPLWGVVTTQVGISQLYNKLYSFYQEILNKGGIKSLLKFRNGLLYELERLEVSQFTNSEVKKVLESKERLFKKNFQHLTIFKDFIFKFKNTVEQLLFIKKVLKVLINYTFLPLLFLSIFLVIRKVFILISLLFTSGYTALRFGGQNELIVSISSVMMSIRDGVVRVITKLVNLFLGVKLYSPQEFEMEVQITKQAMELRLLKLESLIRSLPPAPATTTGSLDSLRSEYLSPAPHSSDISTGTMESLRKEYVMSAVNKPRASVTTNALSDLINNTLNGLGDYMHTISQAAKNLDLGPLAQVESGTMIPVIAGGLIGITVAMAFNPNSLLATLVTGTVAKGSAAAGVAYTSTAAAGGLVATSVSTVGKTTKAIVVGVVATSAWAVRGIWGLLKDYHDSIETDSSGGVANDSSGAAGNDSSADTISETEATGGFKAKGKSRVTNISTEIAPAQSTLEHSYPAEGSSSAIAPNWGYAPPVISYERTSILGRVIPDSAEGHWKGLGPLASDVQVTDAHVTPTPTNQGGNTPHMITAFQPSPKVLVVDPDSTPRAAPANLDPIPSSSTVTSHLLKPISRVSDFSSNSTPSQVKELGDNYLIILASKLTEEQKSQLDPRQLDLVDSIIALDAKSASVSKLSPEQVSNMTDTELFELAPYFDSNQKSKLDEKQLRLVKRSI